MAFVNNYGWLDRLFHYLAFHTRGAQLLVAGLEDRHYQRALARIPLQEPVFVTGLPRAGTTLLLEIIESTGEFASHTYRDMPMVLTPLFWSRVSHYFKRNIEAQQRAHGDGMTVGLDSPEALEEVVWMAFWRDQYGASSITPWDRRLRHQAFEEFFASHARKILLEYGGEQAAQLRYLSKNNLNIARLGYIAKAFPSARIVVPFRDPFEHAASMLRQHRNFLAMHADDAFARRYMRHLGHFDFGANLKPVNFSCWLDDAGDTSPLELAFWLRYWVSCYRFLLDQAPTQARFFSYDRFCQSPQDSLVALARHVGVRVETAIRQSAARVTAATPYQVDRSSLAPALVDDANRLHQQLLAVALNA